LAEKGNTKTKYVIGIDSGASSSEVVILPLFKRGKRGIPKKYPPINFNVLGFEESSKRLTHIIKDSSKKIGFKNIAYIVAGIAGARNEKDRNRLAKKAAQILKFKNIAVYPDTAIAFASIFDHRNTNCGILLAGTGSVLYFVNSKGMIERYGGWGRILGDEGSGYMIAREALNRLTHIFDKRVSKSMLEQVLNKKLSLNKDNIIKKVYHDSFDIAKVTRYVFDCAEAGDRISNEIIKEAAEKLAHHFIPLGKTKSTVALCGSLFTEEKLLEKYLRKIVEKEYPNIILIKSNREQVWGAVEIGKALYARR
jgi:glucosamine kinase